MSKQEALKNEEENQGDNSPSKGGNGSGGTTPSKSLSQMFKSFLLDQGGEK